MNTYKLLDDAQEREWQMVVKFMPVTKHNNYGLSQKKRHLDY